MPNPMTKEFGLRHKIVYSFGLRQRETSSTHFATMLPLFFADQAKNEAAAQAIQVNRANDNYEGVVSTPACFMNSRINKIKVTEYVRINSDYDLPDCHYEQAVISMGLGDVDIKDPQGNTLLSKLKLTQAADTLHPTWSNTNINKGCFCHADVDGLTTDQELETVALRPSTLREQRDGSLGPKVRKVVAGPGSVFVHKDFPRKRAVWYDVPGQIKRMNAFTACFLYVGLNQVIDDTPTSQQNEWGTVFTSDITLDEDTTDHFYMIEFNEYNDSFDQNA